MSWTTGGVVRRAVAGSASAALAVAGLALAAAPAHAAPVTVTGTLTDAAGNVLDGYVAALVQQPDGTFTYGPTQYVVDGVISLPVEPGVYKFEFGDQEDNFVSEFYNDKATEATAEAVPVSGPVTLAPVVLASRPAYVGQVLSPSGRPVEDASVQVLDPTTGASVASGRTRPDGAFRVAAPAGQYKIRISGSGFSPEYYNNKATLAAADLVGLGGADVGLGTITLQEGTTVTGKAANPAGTGIERIAVTLSPTSGGGSSFTDSTDAAGMIRLEGVAPGTYKVRFSDPIGEYLTEYWNDKPDFATGDVLTVGLDPVNDVNAVLSPDPTNVAPDPATVDLSGVITDSAGKPVAGATVEIWDTPADGDRREVIDSTYTNRGGSYHFTRLDKTYLSEDTFNVRAADNFEVEEGSYNRLPRWWGGAQTYAGARTVGVPTSAVNVALPLTGGVSGTVTSEAGLPVGSVQVTLFDAEGNGAAAYGYASVEENGTFSTTSLVPGTYKVLFNGSAPWSSGIFDHAPEWYDDTTFEKAEVITVKSGQTVTGIDAALSQQFKALRKPEIRGNQYLGGKLRAWSGVWALQSNTTYLYEWLIGDTVVGTGRTYEVTKAAKNKRITLRVLAENGNLNGTALVSTQVIKKKPKVSITVTGKHAKVLVKAKKVKPKKFKGTVVVKKIVRTDDYGSPVYKTIGKAKLRNGSAALTLKKLAKGKNKLVFFITLKGGKYGDAEVAKTVRIKG
jgi:hypothetical protein